MAQPRPPQQLRAKRTRRKLLGAARTVFAEQGYEGATVDDVVGAAGCSKGAYYFHFATKEDALLALVDLWVKERSNTLVAAAKGALASGTTVGPLLEALLATPATWPPRLLLEFWSHAERSEPLARRLIDAEDAWRSVLTEVGRRLQKRSAVPRHISPEALADLILLLDRGATARACLSSGDVATGRRAAATAAALIIGQPPLRKAG